MTKSDVRGAILQKLREELALQASAAELAHEEATSEESRARSKYDTHSQEAAYLAQGQAKLVAEIKDSLHVFETLPLPGPSDDATVTLGALVELESDGHRAWYFLGPRSGGLEVAVDGREILVLTTQSPLGHALVGKRTGEVVQTPGRTNTTDTHRIVRVE
ncbi:MAG: transcription elongation factor [Opitutus sp.]